VVKMAWLRKHISKNTYLTLIGIWNALSIYIGSNITTGTAEVTLINVIGNLIIAWVGVESGHTQENEQADNGET